MKLACSRVTGRSKAALLTTLLVISGCQLESDDDAFSRSWTWSDLGGPDAAVSELVSNHEALAVVGSRLLLGTGDGVWERPLSGAADWERSGLAGRSIHALAVTADGSRIIAAGFDPDDEMAPTTWYSTDQGLSWTAAATWPRGAPGGPDAGLSYPFYSLEPDPEDSDVVYGGLDADTVAVTVDGGATWIMTDGATSPNFGYACVSHRSAEAAALLQGCELPLDVAWVGARRVVEDDRFQLPDFRFLYGHPDSEELANRRINAIVGPPGRDDRILVGVEGGLVELTSTSGNWTDRSDVEAHWVFRSEEGAATPYAYIRAIAPLDASGRHLLFGGTVNGLNTELSLFEAIDGGRRLGQLEPPSPFHDPRVEQAWPLGANDVLLVISQIDAGDPQGELAPHYPRVYRLRRP